MPENSRLLPAPKEIKVRLYGQGLGDCFLLAFPREDRENPCYMVIDCGAALSTPARDDRARKVVADIRAATGGHLDVLAITHQHFDHISGFDDAWAEWKTLSIDALYLPWTESDAPTGDHKSVSKLREALDRAAKKALERASASDLASEPAFRAQADFLGFDLGGGGLAAAGGMDGTMERIRSLCPPDRVRYFEPGDVFQLPGTACHGYVLGPPLPDVTDHRGKKLIELLVDEDDEIMYSYAQLGMPVDEGKPGGPTAFAVGDDRSLPALGSGLLAADLVDREVDEGFCPFGPQVRLDWDSAMGSKFFQRHYGEARQGENGSWRRIDHEWMGQAGTLALRAGGFTNNLSLVLAFDVPESTKMLLFAGDAQVGNWLSWHRIEAWRFRDGTVPDRPPVEGDTKTLMEDLLSRVVFYKVGHHASHNATIRTKGLEAMTRSDLVAYIPVSVPVAQDRMGYCPMPFYPVVRALHRKTRGRTFLPNGQAVKIGDSSDRRDTVLRKEAGLRISDDRQAPLEVSGTVEPLPLYLELSVGA